MLNRRHLRIKILQALYAFEQAQDGQLARGEKELFHAINKMYEMYIFLLLIMPEFRSIAEQRIEEGLKKRLPTETDLNPNRRFADNRFLIMLEDNIAIKALSERHKVNWVGEGELLRRIYRDMIETEEYQAFMNAPSVNFEAEKEVVIRLFKRHIINHESLQYFFEEHSIFWVDDLDIVASMTIKTLKTFQESTIQTQGVMPLWKADEDEQDFVKVLFRKTIVQSPEHMELIKKHAENWELERIALMDTLLMRMALTEAREFRQIPVKVSLNEYIELAKYYSTPKSSTFINGVLDKIFDEMKDEGTIKKAGRGLIT